MKLTIPLRDGKKVIVTTYRTDVPGLVVHRDISQDLSPGETWTVTHLESKMSVFTGIGTRRNAIWCAGQLSKRVPGIDWTKPVSEEDRRRAFDAHREVEQAATTDLPRENPEKPPAHEKGELND